MKTINIPFDDEEHKNLNEFKSKLSWHDFILLMYTHCIEAERRGDFKIFNDEKISSPFQR